MSQHSVHIDAYGAYAQTNAIWSGIRASADAIMVNAPPTPVPNSSLRVLSTSDRRSKHSYPDAMSAADRARGPFPEHRAAGTTSAPAARAPEVPQERNRASSHYGFGQTSSPRITHGCLHKTSRRLEAGKRFRRYWYSRVRRS